MQVREPDKEGYVEGGEKLNLHQSAQRLSSLLFGKNVELYQLDSVFPVMPIQTHSLVVRLTTLSTHKHRVWVLSKGR